MKTYVLTDASWQRGQGTSGSYIVPPDHVTDSYPRCCLGNVAKAENLACDIGLSHAQILEEVLDLTPELSRLKYSGEAQHVYALNDVPAEQRAVQGLPPLTDEQRVMAINTYTRKYGFMFVFQKEDVK